jgi:hypothetical protein
MAFRSKDLMLHVLPGESEPVRWMTCQPLSPLEAPKPAGPKPPGKPPGKPKPPEKPKPGGKKRTDDLLLTALQQQLRETLARDR